MSHRTLMQAFRRGGLLASSILALSVAALGADAQGIGHPGAPGLGHPGGQSGGQNHVKPPPPIDSSAVPKPELKTGCTGFDVWLNAGSLVTVARAVGAPCGPIEPILVGLAAFDTVNRVVTLPIALVNRGVDRLHTPVALVGGRSALVVTAGAAPPASADSARAKPPSPNAGATPGSPNAPTPSATPPSPSPSATPATAPPSGAPGTVQIVGGANPLTSPPPAATVPGAKPGSTRPPTEAVHFVGAEVPPPLDSTGEESPAVRWTFDKLLVRPGHDPVTADDGSTVLRAGDTTVARPITVAVPKGVTGFRVTVQGDGLYVFTVPFRAPETVPRDEQEDSRAPDNVLSNVPGLPGRVVRNKLWVAFRQDASPELRQAAVDSVDAVVVGGMLRGNERYYYLRITANPDSGAAPLEHALRTLAPMPQVQDVMPDRLP